VATRLVIGDAPRARGRRRRPQWIIAAVVVLASLRFFVLSFAEVQGDAMAPNALQGDVLLVLHAATPALGDVVVVEGKPNAVLRRILGTAGDRISATGGRLIRNGDPLQSRSLGRFAFRDGHRVLRQHRYWEALSLEAGHATLADFISAPRSWNLEFPETVVPPGHVFAYCDNRRQCPPDDRAGVLSLEAVSGVAWGLMWFGDARMVEPVRPVLGAYSALRSTAASTSAGLSAAPTVPRK
jgi:signal peptidase I